MIIKPVKFIENENKNATGEDIYAGALRGPRAGSPTCIFVIVFVFDELDRPDNHARANMIKLRFGKSR